MLTTHGSFTKSLTSFPISVYYKKALVSQKLERLKR